jgi:2-C-methyl-D-erythritol 4-phosphate cytidylyltransferase
MAKFGVIVFCAAPDSNSSPSGALVKIDGREAVMRSVELFVNQPDVTQIVVGFSPADAENAKTKFGSHLMIMGFKLATGGPQLRDQLKACAEKLPADVTHVVLHDAARVLVSSIDLDNLFQASTKHNAAALVAPVSGTVVTLDESGTLSNPVSGRTLRQLAWPQVFSKKLFDEILAKGFDSVLSRITPIDSSGLNMRINAASEASLVKNLLALLPKPKAKASNNPFDEAQW